MSASKRSNTEAIFSPVRGARPGTTSASYRTRKSFQRNRDGITASPAFSFTSSSPAIRSATLRSRASPDLRIRVLLVRSLLVMGSRHCSW